MKHFWADIPETPATWRGRVNLTYRQAVVCGCAHTGTRDLIGIWVEPEFVFALLELSSVYTHGYWLDKHKFDALGVVL